jgi:hypothetical protein
MSIKAAITRINFNKIKQMWEIELSRPYTLKRIIFDSVDNLHFGQGLLYQ